MATQKLKGLWIPVEILLNENLSDKEKIILSMILYLSEETKSCFASNKYIANIVNVTSDRVSKIISSLKEKEYISVKLKYKTDSKEIEERQITPVVENINRYSRKCLEAIDTNNYSASQKQLDPIGENDRDIINNIKNNIKKIIIIKATHIKRKIFHIEVTDVMMTSIGIAYMQIIKRLLLLKYLANLS